MPKYIRENFRNLFLLKLSLKNPKKKSLKNYFSKVIEVNGSCPIFLTRIWVRIYVCPSYLETFFKMDK